MATPPPSKPQTQEENVTLQSFPNESASSDNSTPPEKIVHAKATEVALLTFSPEEHARHRRATDSTKVPLLSVIPAGPPTPAPLRREVIRHRFPVRNWVLAVLVSGVAIAAVLTFWPARVPAKSLAEITPAPANVVAAAGTASEPTVPQTLPPAAEPEPVPPPVGKLAITPGADRTGTTGRNSVGGKRAAANVATRRPPVAAPSKPVPPAVARAKPAPPAARAKLAPATPARAKPASTATYRGSLAVTSSPAGATVYVNGVSVGATPLVLRNVSAGSRAVRLELADHERWSSAVRIIASEETRVAAQLRRSTSR